MCVRLRRAPLRSRWIVDNHITSRRVIISVASLPPYLGLVWLCVCDRPNGRVKANGDPGAAIAPPAEREGNIAKCYGRICAANV